MRWGNCPRKPVVCKVRQAVCLNFRDFRVRKDAPYRGVCAVLSGRARRENFQAVQETSVGRFDARNDFAVVHDVTQCVHDRYNRNFRAVDRHACNAEPRLCGTFHTEEFADGRTRSRTDIAGRKIVFFGVFRGTVSRRLIGKRKVFVFKVKNRRTDDNRHDLFPDLKAFALFRKILHNAA